MAARFRRCKVSIEGITGEGRIITLMEAARLLSTSYPTAHRMACSGELKAFRVRNAWRTSAAACEEYVSRRFAEQERACHAAREGRRR
jgi:excisionase family DNA binding protein